MKSLRLSLVTATLVAGLAACGGAQANQPTTAGPAPTVVEAAPPAAGAPAAPKITKAGPNVTPDGVVFNFEPGGGHDKKIYLAASFNDWNKENPQFLLKDDDGDGIWSITVKLPPGTYQYKYVVDGKWTQDPAAPEEAPDGFGGRNSKFEVK
ncbi:MAG TPA: glycogen-binding domain-containing protein [Kofleriaceae bacterium]|nr:glycogen-binding domain-containing protein [Kofleriaceae bacterium]